MIHIVYFSLLLFCISTNMTHGAYSVKAVKLQAGLEENKIAGPSLASALLAIVSPRKSAAQSPIKTKSSIASDTNIFNLQGQSTSSSSNSWQSFSPTTKEKRKLTEKQPLKAKKRRTTESLIPSDDEGSTIFDQEFDDQEAFTSKQPPRKKRRVNKKYVPDSSHFTINCIHCSFRKQFQALSKSYLINNFKRHLKSKHSSIDDKKTEIYIEEYLQEPELFAQFSVHCPESECKDTLHSFRKHGLKLKLFTHISTKHQKNKNNYSKEFLAAHVKNNYKQTLVPAEKQLKNRKKVNDPNNAYFTIACPVCPEQQRLRAFRKSNIIHNFKRHLENKHSSTTEEQTKNYIKEHLQEPKQFVNFSVHCPEPKCKYIAHAVHRSNLKTRLSKHISSEHQENKDNHSVQSIKTYVEGNCKQRLVSAQEQLKNTNKRKRVNDPNNAYFTLTCPYCSGQQQFRTHLKNNSVNSFKRHLKIKHPDITEEQTKNYIKQNLQEPEQLVKFSVHCPELECKQILHAHQMSNLKINLSNHISTQHQENKNNHSKESVETYVEGNCNQRLVSAQEQLNTTKKRKTNK